MRTPTISAMNRQSRKIDDFDTLVKDVQQLLNNKVFLGTYTEKRYVDSIQGYRDVIVIGKEDDIYNNLILIKEKFESHAFSQWIGISVDEENNNKCLLWVLLNDVPVGKHWFQACAIRFEAKEIILEVKYVQTYKAPEKVIGRSEIDFPTISFQEIFTYENFRAAAKFIAVLVMVIFTLLVEILRYLGEYSIQFSHVLASLIHASTPICLGMMEFLTRCVGGMYWLVYVLIRQPPNAPAVPAALLSNQRQYQAKPIDYNRSRYSYNKETYGNSEIYQRSR